MTLNSGGPSGRRSFSITSRLPFPNDLSTARKCSHHQVPAHPAVFDELSWPLPDEVSTLRAVEEMTPHRQRLDALGLLAAGVAHDFNNLVTAITGNLTLLLDRLEDEQSRQLARRSLLAAERAAAVTKRLLTVGRGKQLEVRSVDPKRFIAAVVPRLRDVAGPSIEVKVVSTPAEGRVKIDRIELELALINLVANARDAMPEGGCITIETSWRTVVGRYGDVSPGEWALICVTDRGCGMSPDVSARAFDPFFTTKEAGAGTGLGLSMVRDLARQLGGDVAIRSRLGEGTSVLLFLPRSSATDVRTKASRQRWSGKGGIVGSEGR